jgi:hypothetical protein
MRRCALRVKGRDDKEKPAMKHTAAVPRNIFFISTAQRRLDEFVGTGRARDTAEEPDDQGALGTDE